MSLEAATMEAVSPPRIRIVQLKSHVIAQVCQFVIENVAFAKVETP